MTEAEDSCARAAREWLADLQDKAVRANWKSEAARNRHLSSGTPLFPNVYWSRTAAESSLAALLRHVEAAARAEERARCIEAIKTGAAWSSDLSGAVVRIEHLEGTEAATMRSRGSWHFPHTEGDLRCNCSDCWRERETFIRSRAAQEKP